MHFHIIECTPGYMPESDEDYRVETATEAVEAVTALTATYVEDVEEVGATATVAGAGTMDVLIGRDDRMYDLGRIIYAETCIEAHA